MLGKVDTVDTIESVERKMGKLAGLALRHCSGFTVWCESARCSRGSS